MDILLKKIKALKTVFSNEVPTQAEITFKNAKLENGDIIEISGEVAVGSKIQLVNEDATKSAPKAGELKIKADDGTITIVTVDEAGVITAVAEAKAEDTEQEMKTDAPVVEETKLAADPEAPAAETPNITGRVEALEATVNELFDVVNKLVELAQTGSTEMAAVKKENEVLKSQKEDLSKKAAVAGVNFKKVENPDVKIQTKELTLMERIKARKKN
jgi:hypothetical protein